MMRLPNHMIKQAKTYAMLDGVTLNEFLSSIIAERLGEIKAEGDLDQFEDPLTSAH